MQYHRNSKLKGFTIVELLIVIVVIGILAAIVIVAYNGVQNRAQNAQRVAELSTWQKAFEAYRAQEGKYPTAPDYNGFCLGSGFPAGYDGNARCRDYNVSGGSSYRESDSAAFMTDMKKVINTPKASASPVGPYVGPYALYNPTTIQLTAILKGTAADCPNGTQNYPITSTAIMCWYVLTK